MALPVSKTEVSGFSIFVFFLTPDTRHLKPEHGRKRI